MLCHLQILDKAKIMLYAGWEKTCSCSYCIGSITGAATSLQVRGSPLCWNPLDFLLSMHIFLDICPCIQPFNYLLFPAKKQPLPASFSHCDRLICHTSVRMEDLVLLKLLSPIQGGPLQQNASVQAKPWLARPRWQTLVFSQCAVWTAVAGAC